MTCAPILYLSAGGNYGANITLRDENGAAIDGTGFTPSIAGVTGDLGGAVTLTTVDATAGLYRFAVAWQGAWPLTPGSILGTFRVALTNGPQEKVWPASTVVVDGVAVALETPRGNDVSYAFTWPDDRDGASLTGETVDVFNASPTLAPLATVQVVDTSTRACRLLIEGDLSVALGPAGTLQLRRRIAGAQPRTLPPFAVRFT